MNGNNLFLATLLISLTTVVHSISATGDLTCNSKYWTEIYGEWIFTNKCEYGNTDDTVTGAISWIGHTKTDSLEWIDYTVEATLTPVEGKGDTGLAFHVQEVGDCDICGKYYAVSIKINDPVLTVILGKWNNNYNGLLTWDIPYQTQNASFHIKVTIINGNEMKFWINDHYIGGYTDSNEPWIKGSIGVRNSRLKTIYKNVCVNGCNATNNSANSNGGWIFIAIVFSGFFLYCCIGYILNGYKSKQYGNITENIPHLPFWKTVPKLVSVGCQVSIEFMKGILFKKVGDSEALMQTIDAENNNEYDADDQVL